MTVLVELIRLPERIYRVPRLRFSPLLFQQLYRGRVRRAALPLLLRYFELRLCQVQVQGQQPAVHHRAGYDIITIC